LLKPKKELIFEILEITRLISEQIINTYNLNFGNDVSSVCGSNLPNSASKRLKDLEALGVMATAP